MNDEDFDVLWRTLWGEARGEGTAGMEAVASVIANRRRIAERYWNKWGKPHPLFGDGTWRRVCLARKQFSCWNADDPNRTKLLTVQDSAAMVDEAKVIAHVAMAGELADPTGGADHYVTQHFYGSAPVHHWCRKTPVLTTIGTHVFFKGA